MELTWYCSTCGKQANSAIELDKSVPGVVSVVVAKGWIVQHNGVHTDLYCSKQCAA